MAASRMLLVLLSMALLALTSARKVAEDDENSLQEIESPEGPQFQEAVGNLRAGVQEVRKQFQDQAGEPRKMVKDLLQKGKKKLNKQKGQGRNQDSNGDSLSVQDRQGNGGQGGKGRKGGKKGGKDQKAKGGRKMNRGKDGKKNQRENNEELAEE